MIRDNVSMNHLLNSFPLTLGRCFAILVLTIMLVLVAGCDSYKVSEAKPAPPPSQGPDFNDFGFAVEPLGAGVKEEGLHVRTHPRRRVKVVQAKVHLEPGGGNVPWHTHPGPVIGVVTGGGAVTIVREDCSVETYPTGTTFQEAEVIHTARNNTDEPVTVVATIVIEADKKDGSFAKPTTLEPKEVRQQLDAKCDL